MSRFGLDPERAPPAVKASSEPIIRFFSYHDAHPIALGMVCMEAFGHQWLVWEPEALKMEILRVFKATSISDHNWQKIQAFRTLLVSISFWFEWYIFENVIQALNNNIPDPEVVQKCTMSQLMAGVDIANEIREEQYGGEVSRYIAACAIDSGVMYLPPPLSFAQEDLSEPQYYCLVCGNISDDDDKDGRCDVCNAKFEGVHPFDGKPGVPVPPNAGKDIQRFLKRDPAGVKEQFEAWKDLEQADVDAENAIHMQAAKLAVAHKYMLKRRRQLVDQLEELKSWVKH